MKRCVFRTDDAAEASVVEDHAVKVRKERRAAQDLLANGANGAKRQADPTWQRWRGCRHNGRHRRWVLRHGDPQHADISGVDCCERVRSGLRLVEWTAWQPPREFLFGHVEADVLDSEKSTYHPMKTQA